MSFKDLPQELIKSFTQHRVLKVISGLSNFDAISVESVARAAGIGGADLVDVACDPELVRLAIDSSGLPVCASSVEPDYFPKAVHAGAAIIEIGNFDSFYPKGRFFSGDDVLDLTRQTRRLLPEVALSVTIPHVLSLDKQSQLAVDLVELGVDIIQTEGGTSAKPFSAGVLGLIEKAAPTLAATSCISQALSNLGCNIPVLCASGLSSVTVPMAIGAGASGVGVGSAINRLSNDLAMTAAVRSLRESMVLTSRAKVNY